MANFGLATRPMAVGGLRCAECNRKIKRGQVYATVPSGVTDGYLTEDIVCEHCGITGDLTAEQKWQLVECRARAGQHSRWDRLKWEWQILVEMLRVSFGGK